MKIEKLSLEDARKIVGWSDEQMAEEMQRLKPWSITVERVMVQSYPYENTTRVTLPEIGLVIESKSTVDALSAATVVADALRGGLPYGKEGRSSYPEIRLAICRQEFKRRQTAGIPCTAEDLQAWWEARQRHGVHETADYLLERDPSTRFYVIEFCAQHPTLSGHMAGWRCSATWGRYASEAQAVDAGVEYAKTKHPLSEGWLHHSALATPVPQDDL